MSRQRTLTIAAAILLTSLSLPSQRGVRTLTSTGLTHTDVKLSPNGQWVAFRTSKAGAPALGLSHTSAGSKEIVLFSGSSLTRFLWHPDSRGLYYQNGARIEYVRTVGGVPFLVGTLGGNSPTLHTIDPTGKFLLGVSNDVNLTYRIWRLDTDGQTSATTLHTVPFNFLDWLTVDPSGKFIAFTSQPSGVPFAAAEILRIDIDGKNEYQLSGGPMPDILRLLKVSQPRNLAWVDSGKTLLFAAADVLPAPWQVFRISETDPDPLLMTSSDAIHTDISVAGNWAVYRGTILHKSATPHHHGIVSVMPLEGGGRVLLEPETDWVMTGSPSMDKFNLSVAFGGYPAGSPPLTRSEVQMIALDREVRVYPRAVLGSRLNFELPVNTGERGTLFLSTGILELDPKQQLSLPGFIYRVALDPAVLLPVLSGTGTGSGPLKAQAVIPNDPQLIGWEVYLQGLRVRPVTPAAGDLTRLVKLRFFNYRT